MKYTLTVTMNDGRIQPLTRGLETGGLEISVESCKNERCNTMSITQRTAQKKGKKKEKGDCEKGEEEEFQR